MIGREPRSLSLECAEEVELRQNSDSKRKHTDMKGWKFFFFFLAKMRTRCLLEDGIYKGRIQKFLSPTVVGVVDSLSKGG